jgi:2,4-dienoyl-CoA reductase-like NADH-dependent reductase (Old Yellow Enzyme family)
MRFYTIGRHRRIRTEKAMTDAVAEGEIDMKGIAKPLAKIPDLPNRILFS